jgi:hypothetical protein
MKKLLVLILSCSSFFADGQKGVNSFGLGIQTRIPFSMGSYSSDYKDIGPDLQLHLGVTKLGSFLLEISSLFINLMGKESQNISLTGFKICYRSHFLNSGFFVQADGGLVHWWKKKGNNGPVSSWIGGAGGGYSFKLSSTSSLDISSSSNIVFNSSKYKLANSLWINGNILYRFYLKKKIGRKARISK